MEGVVAAEGAQVLTYPPPPLPKDPLPPKPVLFLSSSLKVIQPWLRYLLHEHGEVITGGPSAHHAPVRSPEGHAGAPAPPNPLVYSSLSECQTSHTLRATAGSREPRSS